MKAIELFHKLHLSPPPHLFVRNGRDWYGFVNSHIEDDFSVLFTLKGQLTGQLLHYRCYRDSEVDSLTYDELNESNPELFV